MPRYRPVEAKADFPALERRILESWREARTFERTVELRKNAPQWVFYEGPPTANGKPGIHHVEPRTFKDVYLRFRTMTGYSVPRKAGWDCHGLPVELEVEKEIGTKTKRDIEAFGIAEFNRLCRESVGRYVKDFEALTERIGFWIDMDDAYRTMDAGYVQSVWWSLKELHRQGLLYQDFKVTPYCPRCGTALSDHEVAQGYTTVADPSVYTMLPVADGPDAVAGAALLVWTTTPWTLISNLGAAVDADETYVRIATRSGDLVVAEPRLPSVRDVLRGEGGDDEEVKILDRFPGSTLVGVAYEPPYDNVRGDAIHLVVAADFVTMTEGTGIVHMAPAFGTEDLAVGRVQGWPVYNPVDTEGRFTDLAPPFVRGRFVKEADPDIIEDLRSRGLLAAALSYEHTYPLCWRCQTPLLYYARQAWYVRTTARKGDLLDANERTSWYPEHIKRGRYGDWLEHNVDWSLSRERYWGTPLPVWRCPEEHVAVVGSLAELSDLAGRDVTGVDPHRPDIDAVTFDCPECGGGSRRVTEVIDTWFDSGAMPFAQWGYMGPGSPAAETFRRTFPADFIVEAIDQTRGWFYSLMAESVLLFGENSYRNVVCLGHIVDREGRKMSKSLGNTVDPWEVTERYGADALRWFLLASGSPWSSRRVSMEVFEDVVRRLLLTLWNTYAFFVTYANIDEPDLSTAPALPDRPVLDRWILSRLSGLVTGVTADMNAFDATGAGRRIAGFVDDLSNWYVRRSRRRFWDPAGNTPEPEKLSAHATLRECLVTLSGLMAPFTPFLTEEIYGNLVAERDASAPASIHLTDFPTTDATLLDPGLEGAMATARSLVSLGRTVRTDLKVRVRQPLSHALVHMPGDRSGLEPLLPLVAAELNVKRVFFAESTEELAGWRAKPNFRALGPRLGARVQEVAGALAADAGSLAASLAAGDTVSLELPSGPVSLAPADVELVQQTKAGWGMASDGALTVALDLELTDDLRSEGVARELVHHVQSLRRSAGLEVTDRIVLDVRSAAGSATREALQRHGDQVSREVLAAEVSASDAPRDPSEPGADAGERGDGQAWETVTIDGEAVGLRLRPVAPPRT